MTTAYNVCFVSAPFGTSINLLKKILNSRNISVLDDSTVEFLEPLDTGIRRLMKKADFFIGIIPSQSNSDIVFFEMGLARGANKPVLLLRERDIHLPMEWRELVSVNLSLDDEVSLSTFIDSYLAPEKSTIKKRRVGTGKANSEINIKSVTKVLNESRNGKEVRLDTILRQLFIEAGYRVGPIESHKNGAIADLVVWMDALDGYLLNPILIEAKQIKWDPSLICQAENQLREALQNRKASLGLLILDVPTKILPEAQTAKLPLVLKFSLTELTELLSTSRLEPTIISYRNKIAHGGTNLATNSKY